MVFGAVKLEDVIYNLKGIRVFWVLSIVCYIDFALGCVECRGGSVWMCIYIYILHSQHGYGTLSQ